MKLPKNFGGGGLGNIMKQAQEAMAKAQKLEEDLAKEIVPIDKGPIKAEFTGAGELKSIKIDPSVVDPDDVEMLEDLIVSIVRDGSLKAQEMKAEKMKKIMPDMPGGMPNIPGF